MQSEIAFFPALPVPSPAKPGMVKRFLWHLHDHVVPHARNDYHPHLLSHRSLALISMLLVAAKVASVVLLTISPALSVSASAITAGTVTSLSNQARAEGGLAALTSNGKLSQAAQAKAQALLECQCFSHNIGDTTPWDFIKATGYKYIMAGENLAVNFVEAEDQQAAWMNSPGHRANIMNVNFQEIGIGIVSGEYQGGTSTIVVQMFGRPAVQDVQVSEKPTPVAPAQAAEPQVAQAETKEKTGLSPRSAQAAENLDPIITKPEEAPAAPQPVPEIGDVNIIRQGENMVISVITTGAASRVVATYGQEAIMLAPTSEVTWKGEVPLSKLAEGNRSIQIQAYDVNGQVAGAKVATFASDISGAFGQKQAEQAKKINFFGRELDPNALLSRFYLLTIAGLLSATILAIVIRKHIQHVHMIANSSFVAIVATLLWYTGI